MGRRQLIVVAALAVLACGTVARPAAAGDDALAEPPEAARRAVHLGLDVAVTTSPHGPTVDSFGIAPSLEGGYRFTNGLGLTLDGGLVSAALTVEDEPSRHGWFPGNALFGASFERRLFRSVEGRASLRAGAPLALYHGGIDENRQAELAYTMATSAQGFRDPYLWQMNVVPLLLGGSVTLRPVDWLLLTAKLEPGYLVSVNQRPSRVAIAAHLDATASYRAFTTHAGLYYFASTLPLENRDRAQLALRFGAGVIVDAQHLGVDVSLGLDDPYGAFQDEPHPWWGVSLVGALNVGPQR
jgi:hypothetical protein